MPGPASAPKSLALAVALVLAIGGAAGAPAQTAPEPQAEPAPAAEPQAEPGAGATDPGSPAAPAPGADGAETAADGEAAKARAALLGSWDSFADAAERLVHDESTSTPALERLRERLAEQRAQALEAEKQAQGPLRELNDRLAALGPAPEGIEESPEIAARRQALQHQIAEAQVPVLEAQEAFGRADALIAEIDRVIRARFSAELMSRGPVPLRPAVWLGAASELGGRLAEFRAEIGAGLADPAQREEVLRRLPFSVLLVVAGLLVAFALRDWLSDWVEQRLSPEAGGRPAAWIVALRNLTRIVVPAVGAGLFCAAFDPGRLTAAPTDARFFTLPDFVIVLIVTGWLGSSLLSPRHKQFRLVPLDDADARAAGRVVRLLGVVLALALVFNGLGQRLDLSPTTLTALSFPLVVLGAIGLWRAARLIDVGRQAMLPPSEAASPTMGDRFLRVLVRVLRGVAVVGPLLALAGFLPAAQFFVMRSAATLGLVGASIVVFDLLNRTAQNLLRSPTASSDDGGLMPVVVGAVVGIALVPLLAMTWGARPSDVADAWLRLKEGVTFGGIHLSAGAVVTLVVVFAVGAGITRLLQTVLRSTVLPRTRLDPGGKNAVLAGTGYTGFTLAAIAAVSAAGLDLSNVAIVAGALSVGIGFGLQNIVSNFVSGIILLVERPVKEGDWIEVGGFSGYVRLNSVRSTEIETFDRASVIVPNSDLIAGTVLNRTHVGMSGRLQVPVSVTYDSDPKKVESILLSIAETHPLVLDDPSPRVLFLDLGPDTMNFELRCWLRDVNFSLSVRSDLNFEIVQRFREACIRAQYYGRDLPAPPPEPKPADDGAPPGLVLPGAGTQPNLKAPEQEPPPTPAVPAYRKP
jgi:small-conductance mechanosensitive channel